MGKEDMSKTCGFSKASDGKMSQDEWHKWYGEHCGKCEYMGEICMWGEE